MSFQSAYRVQPLSSPLIVRSSFSVRRGELAIRGLIRKALGAARYEGWLAQERSVIEQCRDQFTTNGWRGPTLGVSLKSRGQAPPRPSRRALALEKSNAVQALSSGLIAPAVGACRARPRCARSEEEMKPCEGGRHCCPLFLSLLALPSTCPGTATPALDPEWGSRSIRTRSISGATWQ